MSIAVLSFVFFNPEENPMLLIFTLSDRYRMYHSYFTIHVVRVPFYISQDVYRYSDGQI